MNISDVCPYRNSGTNMCVCVYIDDILLIPHAPNAPPHPPNPMGPPPAPPPPNSRGVGGVGWDNGGVGY
jgi:hypothetical protein